MIRQLRTVAGAVVGAVVAGITWRLWKESHQSGTPFRRLAVHIPDVMRDDVARIVDAASEAAVDGRRAARRQEEAVHVRIARSRGQGIEGGDIS